MVSLPSRKGGEGSEVFVGLSVGLAGEEPVGILVGEVVGIPADTVTDDRDGVLVGRLGCRYAVVSVGTIVGGIGGNSVMRLFGFRVGVIIVDLVGLRVVGVSIILPRAEID